MGVTVNRPTDRERGSVASELTFGAMIIGILLIGGLWIIAQLEGVSFQVLLQQLRDSHGR